MRLVRYEHGNLVGIGAEVDGSVVPTGHRTMLDVIEAGQAGLDAIAGIARSGTALEGGRILAPIQQPGKILCCGVNYASHIEENPGATLPNTPFFFAKLPSAVIGPGESIVIPSPESQVDWEVELAVIIGRTARKVSRADALDYVFGYTILHDVSSRDVQFVDQQITLGKGFDTYCPLGPVVVLKDEIPNPQALKLASYVNGEQMQDASTADMIFDVRYLIAFLSANITLNPGDIISTGTPAGVGTFRDPPVYLKPGDVTEVEVEKIGRLSNPVVAGW